MEKARKIKNARREENTGVLSLHLTALFHLFINFFLRFVLRAEPQLAERLEEATKVNTLVLISQH